MAQRTSAIFDSTQSFSPASVAPPQTALLLMDYHNFIVGMVGEQGASVLAKAAELRDWAAQQHIHVFHCLIDTTGTPSAVSKFQAQWPQLAGMLQSAPQAGEEAAAIAPKGAAEKVVVREPGLVSALESVGFRATLKEAGVKSLILAGLSSSGVVLSTTRGATDEGFLVTVAQDACADPVADLHKLLMETALPMTGHVATAQEIQEALKAKA